MEIALLWPLGLTVLLAIGAYTDVTARRLPNWLSLALLVSGLVFATTQGGWSGLGWHAAHAAIALLVGMALFATGGIGGGDAKFYTGLAAWFALADGLDLLLWVSIAGIVLILGWIVLKRTGMSGREKPEGDFAKFPYGLAIAVGGMITAWLPLVGAAPSGA